MRSNKIPVVNFVKFYRADTPNQITMEGERTQRMPKVAKVCGNFLDVEKDLTEFRFGETSSRYHNDRSIYQVKNKTAADVQITAEQLLREAKERELEIVPPPPKQKISDPEELAEYRLKKRKGFEDNIRKNR